MSKRTIITAAFAALATAVLAGVLLVPGSSAAAGKTLQFRDAQLSFALEPQGDPTVGSRLILTKALYNRTPQFGRANGARVGSAEIICTVVSDTRAQCTVTAHVPNGEIVAMGAMVVTANGRGVNRFAIVGGAGAYSGARGEVDSRDVSDTSSLVTLHVS